MTYANLVKQLKNSQSYLIILSHPLHPSPGSTRNRSPERTWTCSIVWRTLIWSSYSILFIRLQLVRVVNSSNNRPSSHKNWRRWDRMIRWEVSSDHSSDHPILLIRLQSVRELGQFFWIPLIWSLLPVNPIIFILLQQEGKLCRLSFGLFLITFRIVQKKVIT